MDFDKIESASFEAYDASFQTFVAQKIEEGIHQAELSVPWLVNEIHDLKQRIEELEIELWTSMIK
jgi:hypothetical protein